MELEDFTGTPITGRGESAATIPGRWAAPPAPAMITEIPLLWAFWAKSTIFRGVLCAETILISKGTSNLFSRSAAFCITGKSESEPMIIATIEKKKDNEAAKMR
jgi:hypothetical protein